MKYQILKGFVPSLKVKMYQYYLCQQKLNLNIRILRKNNQEIGENMNICFIIGKVISNIEFKFVLNSNHISIAIFELLLKNRSKIIIKAYDEMADKCYKEIVKNDIIAIQGKLNSKMEIIINNFNYL